MQRVQFIIRNLHEPARIDKVLRTRYPQWGRRAINTILNAGQVMVNGRTIWLGSWKVKNGDRLEVLNPPTDKRMAVDRFQEEWILAREGALIVLNKPAGLLAEPTRANRGSSLLTLAQSHFGPVTLRHRLDRDTSGVILLSHQGPAAKSLNQYLDQAFKSGRLRKEYVAIIHERNRLKDEGTIRTRLDTHQNRRDMMAVVQKGGRLAITEYKITHRWNGLAKVILHPKSGRMHQLRVHMQYLGAPIVGDRLYDSALRSKNSQAKRNGDQRLMLHARQLMLPQTEGYPERCYVAPLPDEFSQGNPTSMKDYSRPLK
ncbi:MAG: RluA family pseudouridine synthase [Chloroflexota bacterium]